MRPVTNMTKKRRTRSRPLLGQVTAAQVAERAGVSKMTVSRVVNGSKRVTDETRRAVKTAIKELGFVPSQLARRLTGRRLGVVALLVPDLANPFFTQVIHGCEDVMRDAGFTILLGNSGEAPHREKSFLETVGALQVDGVILGATGDAATAAVQRLQRAGIAVVLIDRSVADVDADLVVGAAVTPAYLLTQHLLGHGHRRIAMVGGSPEASTSRDRIRGYRDALRDHGIEPDERLIMGGAFTREVGKTTGAALLVAPDRPTAIVAANSLLAFGVIDAALDLDLRVAKDLAVVSFDDVEVTAGRPFLTCADQPAEEVGRIAAVRLLKRLNGDESPAETIVLDTQVRIRASCGCDPGGRSTDPSAAFGENPATGSQLAGE
jgi:LacI family transcriptional regulator